MRYVTITKSRFYNNARRHRPERPGRRRSSRRRRTTSIADNEIFWNNFNFHQGKPPFTVREEGTAALVPIGTGILLLGGRGNRVENNRIYGNYLGGVAAIDGFLVTKNPEAVSLDRNIVRNNAFGLNGTDANGYDIVYDGSGNRQLLLARRRPTPRSTRRR